MKVKVDIFSGFLGAGKTMLIKKLIEEKYYSDTLAIIENEFGEVSIDGAILRSTNTVVREINSGCICCQVTGDFKEAITEIINIYNVERLLIEPTGIAKLSDLCNTLRSKEMKDKVEIDHLITVVDCEKFYLYLSNFKKFFIDQIKTARLIILSRVQLVDEEQLSKVIKDIKKINGLAKIIDYDWYKVKAEELMPKENIIETIGGDILSFNKGKVHTASVVKKKEQADGFQSYALTLSRSVSKEEISSKFKFIAENKNFGSVVRAKGIVKLNSGERGQVNFSLNECSIVPINYEGENVISFIGTDLNINEIKKFFL